MPEPTTQLMISSPRLPTPMTRASDGLGFAAALSGLSDVGNKMLT